MTDDERAALVATAHRAYMDFHGYDEAIDPEKEREAFRFVVAVIEGRIRADERARVVEKAVATATAKIRSKEKQFGPVVTGTLSQSVGDAIRAALGDGL